MNSINLKTGKIENTYTSMRIAADQTGTPYHQINLCCRGKRVDSGGYRWKYASMSELEGNSLHSASSSASALIPFSSPMSSASTSSSASASGNGSKDGDLYEGKRSEIETATELNDRFKQSNEIGNQGQNLANLKKYSRKASPVCSTDLLKGEIV